MSPERLTDADLDDLARRWRSKDGGDDVRRLISALRTDRAELDRLLLANARLRVADSRLVGVIQLCDTDPASWNAGDFVSMILRVATGEEKWD